MWRQPRSDANFCRWCGVWSMNSKSLFCPSAILAGVIAHRSSSRRFRLQPSIFFTRVVRSFNDKFQGIRFRILDLSASEKLDAVAKGEVNFGIKITGAARADLNFTPLADDPFVLACRRDHPLANSKQLTWADLAGHRLSASARPAAIAPCSTRHWPRRRYNSTGFYEVNHLSTSLGLVEAGLGISVMPRLATPQVEHPLIATIPLSAPTVSRTI